MQSILIITCMIMDQIGLHSILLPLLIFMNVNTPFIIINNYYESNFSSQSNVLSFHSLNKYYKLIMRVPIHFLSLEKLKACDIVLVN